MSKDMRGLLDSFESETTVKHEKAVGAAVGRKKNGTRATALVSMTEDEKRRLDRESAGTWLEPVSVLPAGCG